jgi:hypothetical protein
MNRVCMNGVCMNGVCISALCINVTCISGFLYRRGGSRVPCSAVQCSDCEPPLSSVRLGGRGANSPIYRGCLERIHQTPDIRPWREDTRHHIPETRHQGHKHQPPDTRPGAWREIYQVTCSTGHRTPGPDLGTSHQTPDTRPGTLERNTPGNTQQTPDRGTWREYTR